MRRTITFSVKLAIDDFVGGPAMPTTQDLETIAQNISVAIEHFRANEGLSDLDSDIYVECVESVTPLSA